jgi:hypothetical protein
MEYVKWHWHRWSKWKDYWKGKEVSVFLTNPKPTDGSPILIQERRCLVCDAAERRTVNP